MQMLPLVFLEKKILSCPDPVSMLSHFGSKARLGQKDGMNRMDISRARTTCRAQLLCACFSILLTAAAKALRDVTAMAFPAGPAFLLGTWKGRGKVLPRGVEYLETFTCLLLRSEPAMVINWQQFTKNAESLKPMHAENGFLKILPKPEGAEVKKAELMLSHPFSVNEYYKSGQFDFTQNVFECAAETEDCFQRGPTAGGKLATGSRRVYKLTEEGKLVYDMFLRTEGSEEFVHHLHCELEKEETS